MQLFFLASFITVALALASCKDRQGTSGGGTTPVDTATAGRMKPEDVAETPKKNTVANTNMSVRLKESWNSVKGKLKQQYPVLTEEDLVYTEGQLDSLYNRLQQKLGKSRSDVVALLEQILNNP